MSFPLPLIYINQFDFRMKMPEGGTIDYFFAMLFYEYGTSKTWADFLEAWFFIDHSNLIYAKVNYFISLKLCEFTNIVYNINKLVC